MADHQEEAPRSHRLLAVGAVALLAAATALGFGRVFLGRAPSLKLVAAALASVAIASALARRNLLLAALASLAGLYLVMGWLVFPRTLWFGIPAGHTAAAMARALARVGSEASNQVAPTAPLHPLFMAAVTAIWTASFSAHALAVRSGSPLMAAAPPAALLAFAGIVMEDGPRPPYAALFLAGVLAVLFVDGLRRVRQWGPLRPWPGAARPRLTSTTTTRGARRVALAAVGVALIIPGILPGYRSGPVLLIGQGPGAGARIDPIVSVTASLRQREPVELFDVRAERPAYWRWLALDDFNGQSWSSPDLYVRNGQPVSSGAPLPGAMAQPRGTTTQLLHEDIRLVEPPGDWLPMAYRPITIQSSTGSVRFDGEVSAAVPQNGLQRGSEFTVQSLLVQPTPKQLDGVTDFSQVPDRYTQLPIDTPQVIYRIADEMTAGQSTPFRKVVAIQNTLQGFTYDDKITARHDLNYLVTFLTQTHRGFCQQFATAMTVLARALGIPARVAVGFTPGRQGPPGVFHVSTANAHTWVEVYFPSYGWLAFEPTPTRDNPVADAYNFVPTNAPVKACTPIAFSQGSCSGPTRVGTTSGGSNPAGGPGTQRFAADPRNGTPPLGRLNPAKPRQKHRPTSWKLLVAVALLILLASAAVLIPVTKLIVRGVRSRRRASPPEVVLAAYGLFSARAADVGLGRDPSETPWEYATRLRSEVQFSDGHLRTLTEIAARAAYSTQVVSRADAREATGAAITALRDVRRSVPLFRRIAGWWRPAL